MEFPKMVSSAEEFLVCTSLLPAVRARYGGAFVLLEVPEVLRSDPSVGQHGTVYFRNYDGEKYGVKWNEGNGGSGLGIELSSEMVQLLEDFQQIDIDWLQSLHQVGNIVRQSAFDLRRWLDSFQQQKTQAISIGISDREFERAVEFLKGGFQLSRRIVSNGDFYPRNLIKLRRRVVVVDWGHWAGYRACFVDYLANVAAFAFIHMWGNGPWQREFVHHLGETLDIGPDDFRKAVLIKSFEQARFWQSIPHLAAAQANQFRMALRNEIFY